MSATPKQLKQLAELKVKLRKTDVEAAEYFGVSQRTIQRWLHSSAYGDVVLQFRAEQLDSAKTQVAGLADEIISNLRSLMTSSKSDLVRMQSAATLGKWLGLDDLKAVGEGDNKEEVKQLLLMMQQQAAVPQILPPPLPGGSLPPIDAEFSVEPPSEEEKSECESREERE